MTTQMAEAAVPSLHVLGVRLTDLSRTDAIAFIERLMREADRTHAIFIANAHTLNLAADDPEYAAVLNRADAVFGDGTGVRWAARVRGTSPAGNLNGTDLLPAVFDALGGRGYRCFLLGSDRETISRAARATAVTYPGWQVAGFHHGFFSDRETPAVIAAINAARPHLLLVGMGNPRQEHWMHAHGRELRVPVCVGVGGLFDFWAGRRRRAPLWMRRRGVEWLHILLHEPHKWRRYVLGNPKFLYRMILHLPRDRRLTRQTEQAR